MAPLPTQLLPILDEEHEEWIGFLDHRECIFVEFLPSEGWLPVDTHTAWMHIDRPYQFQRNSIPLRQIMSISPTMVMKMAWSISVHLSERDIWLLMRNCSILHLNHDKKSSILQSLESILVCDSHTYRVRYKTI